MTEELFKKFIYKCLGLHDDPAAPNVWSEVIFKLAIDEGCTEAEADKLADVAEKLADCFADEMFKRIK